MQLYDMHLPWGRVAIISLIAIGAFAVSLLIPDDLYTSIGLRVLLYLATITLFFALPVLSRDEKREVRDKFAHIYRMLRTRLA